MIAVSKPRIGSWILLAVLAHAPAVVHAEVVEEIVAWVNGDIITKTEVEEEQRILLAEVYRRFTGAELDAEARRAREEILDRMIDRKILLQRAARMFDLSKLEKSLLDEFKAQNKFKNDEELQRALAQEGMTLDDLKQRLLDTYAPQEIIRYEVIGRLAVSDREIQAYYDAHPEISTVPVQAKVREIVILADDSNRQAKRAETARIRERAVAQNADFVALAAEVSDAGTKKDGGLIGTVSNGDLAPPLEAAAFTVPVGGVSDIIEMQHGFHLLKIDERTEAHKKSLDELKETVRKKLEDEKYVAALAQYLKKARAESAIVVNAAYADRFKPEANP